MFIPGWLNLSPPDSNFSGAMQEVRGLVLHIAEGSYQGTINWQQNPISDVSSHTVHGKLLGERAQMLDLNLTAWTQAAGNGHWVSVEHAGFNYEALTPDQFESTAQLYAFLVQTFGIPLQLAESPSDRGLGWHGMGGAAWGGHYDCPGEPIKAQRPAIIQRAREILAPPHFGGEDIMNLMVAVIGTGTNAEYWAGTGVDGQARKLADKTVADNLIGALRIYGVPDPKILDYKQSGTHEFVFQIIGKPPVT